MIEKILERLSEERIKEQEFRSKRLKENALRDANDAHERIITLNKIEAIVQEVAKEYGKDTNVRSNGWISCSERLPEEQDEYLVYWTAEWLNLLLDCVNVNNTILQRKIQYLIVR